MDFEITLMGKFHRLYPIQRNAESDIANALRDWSSLLRLKMDK